MASTPIQTWSTPMKHVTSYGRILLSATLLLGLAAVASAQDRDDHACSLPRVAGEWGYSETATVYLPSGPVAYASVGSYTIDDDGSLLGARTASMGGKIVTATIKGTAKVDSNCTGTLSLGFYDDSGKQIGAAVKFVVYVDNAREARAIVTFVPGPDGTSVPVVLTTDAKRLFSAKQHRDQE